MSVTKLSTGHYLVTDHRDAVTATFTEFEQYLHSERRAATSALMDAEDELKSAKAKVADARRRSTDARTAFANTDAGKRFWAAVNRDIDAGYGLARQEATPAA